MPDWNKVTSIRVENARKAMELLENTAGNGYDFTEEEALGMLNSLQDSLDNLKGAYAPRLGADFADSMENPCVEVLRESESNNAGAIAIANNNVSDAGHAVNTRSDQPLTIPMWAQISEFVQAVPANQVPAYLLHFGNRAYETAYEITR